EEVISQEPRTILFAPGHIPEATAKRVLPGSRMPIDVLVVAENNQISLATPNGYTPAPNAFSRVGKYILTVKVSGPGATAGNARLVFDWTGDHKTATLVSETA